MTFFDLLLFGAASLGLFYASGAVVYSLTWIGRYFAVSEYLLALILIAFATSLDELFVGISLGFSGAALAALGNLIGANVLNVTLLLGEAILFVDMERRRKGTERAEEEDALAPVHTVGGHDALIILCLVLLPLLLLLDGTLGRMDGAFLIISFFWYARYLFREERAIKISHPLHEFLPGIYKEEMQLRPEKHREKFMFWARLFREAEFNAFNFFRHGIVLFFGLALLLGSAWVMATMGISFAEAAGIPLFFIGILVAIGTTLPEAAFNIRTIFMHHSSMALGNVLGSVVVNTSAFLGVVALLHPIVIADRTGPVVGLLLVAVFVAMTELLAALHIRFPRALGIFLILLSFAFIAIEYFLT